MLKNSARNWMRYPITKQYNKQQNNKDWSGGSMKTNKQIKVNKGFTLVEMIGVLAVIAILAGMLIPKIFEAIKNSRINSTLEAYNTLVAAVNDHVGKWGKFCDPGGTNITSISSTYAQYFDSKVLFPEGRITAPAYAKIRVGEGTTTTETLVELVKGASTTTGAGGYDLDGDGTIDTANAAWVAELKIKDVSAEDARELSIRLDGLPYSATNLTSEDGKGRVAYAAPTDGKTTVYIYIGHL